MKRSTNRHPLALVAILAVPLFAQKAAVPVCVFTAANESGFVDADSKGRTQAVALVRQALAKKRKTIALVPSPAEAVVKLEVLEGKLGPSGEDWEPLAGRLARYQTNVVILARLSVGDAYSTTMLGKTSSRSHSRPDADKWNDAVRDLAEQVEQWVIDNDARLPRK